MDRERLASAQRIEEVRSAGFAMIGFKITSAVWETLEMEHLLYEKFPYNTLSPFTLGGDREENCYRTPRLTRKPIAASTLEIATSTLEIRPAIVSIRLFNIKPRP